MPSLNFYEKNLQTRLAELRRGDRAYELHGNAILETLPYNAMGAQDTDTQRILDIGCGLGFIAAKLATWPNTHVTGIDPSNKAIALATREHAAVPNLQFMVASGESFPAQMKKLGEQPFSRAIINMVLHSIDDETCANILTSARETLVPHGILTLVVPGREWLVQKLIEKAQSEGMEKTPGLAWISDMMDQQSVDLSVGISGQPDYEGTITIYNRDLQDYAELLRNTGFGLEIITRETQNPNILQTLSAAYREWDNHTNCYDMKLRGRHVLMTQSK